MGALCVLTSRAQRKPTGEMLAGRGNRLGTLGQWEHGMWEGNGRMTVVHGACVNISRQRGAYNDFIQAYVAEKCSYRLWTGEELVKA